MHSGLSPEAPVSLLKKDLGPKRAFIRFFTTSFTRLRVRVTHSKSSKPQVLPGQSEHVRKIKSKKTYWIGGEKGERMGKVKSVLTIRTDVLTTSETLCLSSAAVPGFPNPRVNLRVSWCAGVAIVSHLLASMNLQNPRLSTKFRGESSPFHSCLRSPVRTSRTNCVAPQMSVRSHFSLSYFSHIH